MMTPEVDAIFKGYGEAWASYDMDRILSFYTNDCVYEDTPSGTTCNGKSELRSFFVSFLSEFPDIEFELIHLHDAGNCVCLEYWMKRTQAGKPISVRTASIYELAGDRFKRVTNYYNLASLRQEVDG